METIIVPPASSEPTLSELRAMVGTTAATETKTEAKTETSETTEAEAKVEHPETATETVKEKSTPEKTDDEPELPKGVQKKIAQEAEKAAKIQAEIARVVSERKAKEAELAKLKGDEKGSEPVKTPQSSTERPKRPQLGEAGHETETWDQYQAREASYEEARDKFLKAETLREFQETQTREAAQKAAKEKWDAAVTKHGKDFPALMEAARELAPEGLQKAISGLDNWDTVAVHLAKNPAQLKELAETYAQDRDKAIRTLGRIEDALKSQESKPATKTEKPLPEPLKKVGGTASASGEDFQTGLEKGSFEHAKALVKKARAK